MGNTTGTRNINRVLLREKRLANNTLPSLKKNAKINESSALNLLKPLSRSKVSAENYNYSIHVLREVSEKAKTKSRSCDIARFIASDIIPGLVTESTKNIEAFIPDGLDKSCSSIIESGLESLAVSQRILNNQSVIDKRFDVDKLCEEYRYNVEGLIEQLCILIDTYDTPSNAKFNVALENITYTMARNNITVDSDMDIITPVVEYFLLRDETISDTVYKDYQHILKESDIFNVSESPSVVVEQLLNNKADYYSSKTRNVLSKAKDSRIRTEFCEHALKIRTEKDAARYISNVGKYIRENKLNPIDEERLCFSIMNIPNCSDVPSEFIDIKKDIAFSPDQFDRLASFDHIISDKEIVTEDDDTVKFDNSTVKDIVYKFEVSQDKSEETFKNFIKSLQDKGHRAFDGDNLHSIFDINGKYISLVSDKSNSDSDTVAKATGNVLEYYRFLSNCTFSVNESSMMYHNLERERNRVKPSIHECKAFKSYYDGLIECARYVEYNHLYEGELMLESAFEDADFGRATIILENIMNVTDELINSYDSNLKLLEMIKAAIEDNALKEFGEVVKLSSIVSIKEYSSCLKKLLKETTDTNTKTMIMNEQYRLSDTVITCDDTTRLFVMKEANAALKEINDNLGVVTEGTSILTTVKLALQNVKRFARNADMKYKSLCQQLDAVTSGFSRSIEKAMTSDRREAIIRGGIVPSFSKIIKTAVTLAGVGVATQTVVAPAILALGLFGTSTYLNHRERQLIYDEIDTELKVVERQIEIALNDGDMNQYRFLLNYQKKLIRELQRIRYKMKVSGRNIPSAVLPGGAYSGRD